jgi:hypothetical protein
MPICDAAKVSFIPSKCTSTLCIQPNIKLRKKSACTMNCMNHLSGIAPRLAITLAYTTPRRCRMADVCEEGRAVISADNDGIILILVHTLTSFHFFSHTKDTMMVRRQKMTDTAQLLGMQRAQKYLHRFIKTHSADSRLRRHSTD